MPEESHHERELGGQLLASVSRSFYLTLKALPGELREPLSLAYLLARTADTIADTAEVPAEVRLDGLRRFRALVENDDGAERTRLAALLASEFGPRQTDAAEQRLMERFADGLAWLNTMTGAKLEAIRQVLRHIIDGQMLDLQRFPGSGTLHSLNTAEELDEYTWLVAGCVGEFWTEMCASELPAALDPRVTVGEMKDWGQSLGKGLQLINVLRDVGEDIDDGRCYLPQAEWHRHGLTLDAVKHHDGRLRAVWLEWLDKAHAHLHQGLHYVQHVADGKLRYATALPLLIGVRTLARLKEASWEEVQRGVKVSRLEIAKILAEAAVACRSADGVGKLYRKLADR
jgi:farnesyl-diphosphate farnesyltransferase